MRTTHIFILCLLVWSCLVESSLRAQTCGPETEVEADGFAGTAYFTYGGTVRSKTSSYKTALAVGQTFVGYTEDVAQNTSLGFFTRYLLPPFALKVQATQGDLLDRIQVSWEIDALGPSPNAGFNIYRDGVFLAAVGANIRSYNDFNVIAGRPYVYTVNGLNLFGEGNPSEALGFQVPNGTVTGWISTVNGSPVPEATVTLTPMQGFSARFEPGDGATVMTEPGTNPFLPALDENWTIALWIKTDSSMNGKVMGMDSLVIRAKGNASGGITVSKTANGANMLSANYPTGTTYDWHHVAITYDGSSNMYRMYFDGVLADQTASNPVPPPDTIQFGALAGSGTWVGRLDEFRIYHRKLDELDFGMVMEGTASSTTPYLTHYWKMDEELGVKSYDIVKRHKLYFCGADFDTDRPPVHTAGVTNEEGFYRIESASYGTGTTFLATPKKNFYMHRSLKFVRTEQDYAKLPDFGITPKATIEMWVNSAGADSIQCLLAKQWGMNNEFRITLTSTGSNSTIKAVLNENERSFGLLGSGYQHLAFTWDSLSGTMTLYKNGALQGSPQTFPMSAVNTGNWSDPDTNKTWILGKRHDNTTFYGGLIDEVAFYDTTLSVAAIQDHFQNARDIQEAGLRVYFALDEGSGNRINNSGSLLLGGGTTYGTEWTPLAVHQVTAPHVFTPGTRQVTLNPSVTSVDQVDFVDRSTIPVIGYVRYKNTDCFAFNVEILVNGESFFPKVTTDSTGKFVIDFDPGTTAILTAKFEDHVFSPASWEVTNLSSPIAGILFSDVTTRTVSGKVAGGLCEKSIITAPPGQSGGTFCVVKVSALDNCFERQILIDNQEGLFEFDNLPPLEKMTIAVVEHSNPAIKTSFDNQGGSVLDISKNDTTINFIYTAPPEVEIVSGLDTFPGCDQIVLDQFTNVNVQIKLREVYVATSEDDGICYLDTADIRILNGFADEVKDTTLSNGLVTYSFMVGAPNPSPPYLKTMQVIATTLQGTETSMTKQAIVTGLRAKENTFTTQLPEIPTLILRDPPGDGSYSFLEKNEKYCQKTEVTLENSAGAGGGLKLILGLSETSVVAPLGIGTEIKFEIKNTIGFDAQVTYERTSESSFETCTSFDTRLTTDQNDLIVGGERGGDLYMGNALNIAFGFVDVVTFDTTQCIGMDSVAVLVQPGDFATTFIYSEFFILNSIIPHLEALAADANADSAAVATYLESIDRWNAIVENNQNQKENARFLKNISFDAGTQYEYAESSDTTSSESIKNQVKGEFKLETNFGFKIKDAGFEGTIRALTVNSRGDRDESGMARGVKTGYFLADDDPLDAFTFDVGMDSVYKTPVFNLKAGQSSCPWEPGTANREAPNLELAPGSQYVALNVPGDEPAVFKLKLGNLSATNEDWTYGFTAVAANNPDGAIIKLNGQPLNYIQQYIVPYGTSQTVTLTVERGPVEYDYDSLLVAQISSCEYERNHAFSIPLESDSMFFSGIYLGANFIRPCSEVNIIVPQQEEWVIFPDPDNPPQFDDNELRITASGYNLNEPYFKLIRVQYRQSGGDGAWINIPGISERFNPGWTYFDTLPPGTPALMPVFTDFTWNTAGLADGPYEVRALTVCENAVPNNNGYSAILKGKIDREPPSLVGVPQPSDGVFNVGDEISFTFNQHINCNALIQADLMNPNNVGLYNTTNDSLVYANITCFENKIVIDPVFENRRYENQILRAELHDIEDLIGNVLTQTDWEFYVDRNELAWLTDSAGITKYEDEVSSVTVKIHNRGGYPVPFSLQDVPVWVHATPDAGTLVPNEIRDIQFTAMDTLALGWLTDSIRLHTETGQNPFFMGGDELLPFAVRTLCRPPDWEVNPGLYQMTMTLITRIQFNSVYSTDPEDVVAAFIDGQVRGVAKPIYVPSSNTWIAFVTIYGHAGDVGKLITYELFDASACLRYAGNLSTSPFNFSSNGSQGSPTNPRVLSDNGTLVDDITLKKGWNWISFNLHFPDSTINAALEQISNPAGDLIKDQTQFSVYNNNTWSGSLSTLGNTSLYMYQAQQPNTIRMTGTALAPDSVTIPVVAGWNWISYIPTYKLPVNAALASLPASGGDIIKGQTAFAQYVNSTVGWIGDLKKLEPHQGYLLKMDAPGGLTYPLQSFTSDEPVYSRNAESISTFWNVDAAAFEHSLTLIGNFQYDDMNATTADMELGAFVGDELRGVGEAIYVEYLDRYLFFLTCYSNTSGEQVHFKLYDGTTGEILQLAEKMVFTPNANEGSIGDPIPFTLQTTGIGPETGELSFHVLPNPFRDETVCRMELPEAQRIQLYIMDLQGRSVFYTDLQAQAGMNTFTWKGNTTRGETLGNGIYFIRLETEHGILTKKVMLQR